MRCLRPKQQAKNVQNNISESQNSKEAACLTQGNGGGWVTCWRTMCVKDRFKNECTLRNRDGHLNGPERRSYSQDSGTDRSFLMMGWVTPTNASFQNS